MTGQQVNLRLSETEVDKLKEIAERTSVGCGGKIKSHTQLVRDTVRAIHFASAKEQASFLGKYAYRQNTTLPAGTNADDGWQGIMSEMESCGVTPEKFESDWLPMIQTVQKIGLDIRGTPSEIFRRASNLAAVMTIVNAVSAKSENVRQAAAEDLLDRAGYKPVERVQSVNVDLMSEAEVDALLRSKLTELGFDLTGTALDPNNSIANKEATPAP